MSCVHLNSNPCFTIYIKKKGMLRYDMTKCESIGGAAYESSSFFKIEFNKNIKDKDISILNNIHQGTYTCCDSNYNYKRYRNGISVNMQTPLKFATKWDAKKVKRNTCWGYCEYVEK